jgi:tetratricopeptide (TPR) repeat protein
VLKEVKETAEASQCGQRAALPAHPVSARQAWTIDPLPGVLLNSVAGEARHLRLRNQRHPAVLQLRGQVSSPALVTVRRCEILVAIMLVLGACLFAQTGAGTIEGNVRSAAGRVLPGATVALVEESRRPVRSATTSSDGTYKLAFVRDGTYGLQITRDGYLEAVRKNIVIRGNQLLVLDIVLKPVSTGASPKSLGPVTFYEGGEFKAAQIKNPGAGGGYSDSASVRGNKLVEQYLAQRNTPSAGEGGEPQPGAHVRSDSSEARLEHQGATLLAAHDYPRAARLFQQAALRYPASARFEMGLGTSLFGQGRYKEAIQAFCTAARLDPENTRAYMLLSEADQSSARPQPQATKLVKRFAKMHSRNAQAQYAYGIILLKQFRSGRQTTILAQARSEFESATALDPGFTQAHLQLGSIFDDENLTQKAIKQYKETIRLDPAVAEAHYRLAQDYVHVGMKAEAHSELEMYERLRQAQVGE